VKAKKTNPLLLALLLAIVQVAPRAGAQGTITPADAWGELAGGLQLRVGTGKNTELLTETRLMLFLDVGIRNVSGAAVYVDLDQATFDFEYEIDGTWYAFVPKAPVRTSLTALQADADFRNLTQAIAPGSAKSTGLTVPLAGRSPALQLHTIASDGLGKMFEPKPGPHVVRVRTGRALDANRPAPVSNPVTVSFRTPARIDFTSQSVSFPLSPDTSLRELRFVSGPADGQALVRDVLSRPPQPSGLQELITAAALQVIEPLPYYDLTLPRRNGAADPLLPASAGQYHYIVRSGDQAVATIGLASNQGRSVLHWVGPATTSAPLFRGLQELAAMEQIRGRNYEPRLLRITGVRGMSPALVYWLRSSSGKPDIFYRPRDPDFRGWTKVESGKTYSAEELLKRARALPVAPRHDEAWAVRAAIVCTKAAPDSYAQPLYPERAEVDIGLSDQQDRIVWYVFIPGQDPAGGRTKPQPGAALLVDEVDGSCKPVGRE
jgi:hypothetical protein